MKRKNKYYALYSFLEINKTKTTKFNDFSFFI
jgi:hypothetical protein